MSEGSCEQCRFLLENASAAISAHARAISLLAQAARTDAPSSLGSREAAVRNTGAALEAAVESYENHRAAHEFKIMTAGSD